MFEVLCKCGQRFESIEAYCHHMLNLRDTSEHGHAAHLESEGS